MSSRVSLTWQSLRAWWWRGGDPMGKSAVATVLVAMLWPVSTALTGHSVSPSLAGADGPVQDSWAWVTLLAVVIFAASFVPRDRQDRRVVEITALALIAATQAAYIAAIEETSSIASPLAQALSAALLINCCGRAVLLGRAWAAYRRHQRAA